MTTSPKGAANSDNFPHDHVWKYFEIHAHHRISMLNFFIVLSGLATAGMGVALQAPPRFSAVGIALGAGLAALSFIFWKLDQRTAFLVKHAERAQVVVEQSYPEALQLFAREESTMVAENASKGLLRKIWTYGRALRVAFVLVGLVGFLGAAASGMRFGGKLQWEGDAQAVVSDNKLVERDSKKLTGAVRYVKQGAAATGPAADSWRAAEPAQGCTR